MKIEDWQKLIVTLESMVSYYERLNLAVTFFMLWKWRYIAAKLARQEDEVLEVGSGLGNFACILDAKQVYCLDPSKKMLLWSKRILEGGRYNLIMGVGEHLPLKKERFDKVFCLFSFRDFFDRTKGTEEIRRALRKGGSFIIIDILRPSTLLRKKIVDTWIRYGTPIALRLLVPKAKNIWERNPYELFFKTYEKFETEKSLRALIAHLGFKDVRTSYLGFGAHMLVATK